MILGTWIAHMRIAEGLENEKLNQEAFLVGNIGPDCGIPLSDGVNYDPPKTVTHFKDEKGYMQPELFYRKYLRLEIADLSYQKGSFFLGYYVHLLTDLAWIDFLEEKKQTPEYREILEEPDYIQRVKRDWYGQDFLYLKNNPNNIFHERFLCIESFPDYLDYFPKGALTRQIHFIQKYYTEQDPETDRPFVYLTKDEMEHFVDDTAATVERALAEKGLW
ncbi:MAG TPA: hypothetical protein VFK33_05845 [Bacillales bacterium]|nr:hypothetical protein [Bacillales bacterium]